MKRAQLFGSEPPLHASEPPSSQELRWPLSRSTVTYHDKAGEKYPIATSIKAADTKH